MAWNSILHRWQQTWPKITEVLLDPASDIDQDGLFAELARQSAPVIWLLGKVQSGKSSIVKVLTGRDGIDIGEGFAACTRYSSVYDFPEEAPVVRFLDTRGLGEIAYDPTEDLAWCEEQAQLLLVVIKVDDPEQESVIGAVAEIRRRHPNWPIIVAQTGLSAFYQSTGKHPLSYPFASPEGTTSIPSQMRRSLEFQRSLFDRIGGSGSVQFVPIDFTPKDGGFEPFDYGFSALQCAMQQVLPIGVIVTRREQAGSWCDTIAQVAQPHILGYASAAGFADIVPAVGLVAVPSIQAKMLHSLSLIYAAPWNKQRLAEFAGALGLGVGVRYTVTFLVRQLGKFIPVYGQTAAVTIAAAASFATTFALGKAAGAYLSQLHIGQKVNANEISKIYSKALEQAFEIGRKRSWQTDSKSIRERLGSPEREQT